MLTRRAFGSALALAAATPTFGRQAPAVIVPDRARPAIPSGVASGDVSNGSAVVWSRTDRPARMVVEYALTDSFQDASRIIGPAALPEDGHTARVVLTGLPPGQRVVYRVIFQDLGSPKVSSHPVVGSFRTAPAEARDVRFAWGGDVAGQGFGIDPTRGGMRAFEAIRRVEPHLFIHSGDHIYADNPILAEVALDDGTTWRNLVTEPTAKVAETLAEFRARYAYNRLDENVRRFEAEVAQLVQWDDHEVLNNWYPGEILDDPRYAVKSVALLAARARRAFAEMTPIRPVPGDPERVYRAVSHGPHLDVFLLDQRTYRGPNSSNQQPTLDAASAFLGEAQRAWLIGALKASRATWKVVASDMPLGLVVRDGPTAFEALANADAGSPLGRELELAGLLGAIKEGGVRNVVWVTADVHHAAAHRYDPARARFTDFDPFWEFVAGPLHAGTFGPCDLDPTFGPEAVFTSVPRGLKPNRPPSDGLQFFGDARIDGRSGVLTVALRDVSGKALFSVDVPPQS